MTYDVVDGRFGTYTIENFSNGVSQGIENHSDFTYQDGKIFQFQSFNGTKNFYYDSNGNLIAASLSPDGITPSINYRYIYSEAGVVICERLDLPYTNAAAQIQSREILTFDSTDNLISAWTDFNQDGQADILNTFTNSGNDITGVNINGTGDFFFTYTNVTDKYILISEKSYGKKVIVCYALAYILQIPLAI